MIANTAMPAPTVRVGKSAACLAAGQANFITDLWAASLSAMLHH